MPQDVMNMVDIESDLGEEQLSQVRFGRSSFLRKAGIALFGIAAGTAVLPREAEAAPYPCSGFPRCRQCRGSQCTSNACRPIYACGGNHCWRTAVRVGGGCRDVYRCCDWRGGIGNCICSGYLGRVC